MNSESGKYIILFGLLVVIIGVVVYFSHDKLHWIGRLPGDIRVEKENFKFYFPIATMIVASLVITALAWAIRKLF